ncbi:MAG: Phosphate ABC transporter, inner membrane subunit PstA [Methanoculleus marisnigri]|uniref:Phosphate transport system permease protein PstA n=1 Tax=Methanoculleus marisnigri TaxID=2198 RepID=A0A117MEP3_9EURY|nr:MAG: Phosphate ABC transporter, inner membrane subunit PstA [Methanoculleus marisnigri]
MTVATRTMRKAEELFFMLLCTGGAALSVLVLFLILGTVTIEALPSLSLHFLITPESASPGLGGAIGNAVVGTLIISLCSTLIATPLALGTAIYLQRYAPDNRLTRLLRFLIEVLSGTPSIVLGIVGLMILVYYMRAYSGGFSLISGSIALAILILPVIERAIEDAIATVPTDLEEGSYALGATKWQTIRNVTIPTVISGILTGIILGFGRAAEESAVVILTAGYTQFFPELAIKSNENLVFGIKLYPLQDLVGTLPYAVYHAYENSNVVAISDGFAAAFILIGIVFLINLTARILLRRYCYG